MTHRQAQHYRTFVESRMKKMPSSLHDMLHMTLGISGEAGELTDAVKKHFAYNKELDTANIIEELGDIVFYIQGFLNVIANPAVQDLDDLIRTNTFKLRQRYPTGYSDADAIARADKNQTE